MEIQELEQSISAIIKDFRQGAVGIELNSEHVHKWVSQFDVDDQKVILEETLQVFQKWYFNKTKIKEFRNEKGLSQQKLADLTGVTRQTINALENARYNPSLLLAFRITKILDKENIEDVFIIDDGE